MQENNKPILHIGMKLYREKAGTIEEYTISKIGNKYFEIAENSRYRYDKNTLWYVNTNSSQFNHKLYLTKQEILDKNELNDLHDKLKRHFSIYSQKTNTLEQLRQVVKILGIDNKSI